MVKPKVSVIIPAYNEEKDIGKCLESLNSQSYKNFEVLVVDDGSTDKTREIASNFKNARVLIGQHKGPGYSRNLGAKMAKGEILVFVDSDMTFDKEYIKNLVSPIFLDKSKKIIGTMHDYEIAINDDIWSRCWGKIRVNARNEKEFYENIMKKEGFAFRAIKKDKFLEFGGFDPIYGYADDQTFWIKYKENPVIAPNSTCYHRNASSLKEVYRQSKWIGASIDNSFVKLALVKYFYPIILLIASPIAIPFLSFKKSIKNNCLNLLFPWMLLFMTARYYGTISGITRKIYLGKNYR